MKSNNPYFFILLYVKRDREFSVSFYLTSQGVIFVVGVISIISNNATNTNQLDYQLDYQSFGQTLLEADHLPEETRFTFIR
jgi:hypothetical protein